MWFNIRCHCIKRKFGCKATRFRIDSGYLVIRDLQTKLRRCTKCLELINPKSVKERKSTVSEREWQPPTAETYSREDALKAEKD